MPLASCTNYNGDEIDKLVADLEAAGNIVDSITVVGGLFKVLYHAKVKPGPKPKETR